MSESANVRSLEAVREFRPAMLSFAEDARAALESLRTEVHRTVEWIDHDRPAYWKEETRKSSDAVSEARSALSKKQVIGAGSDRQYDHDEKIALARAKKRFETAMEKQKAVRQWGIKTHRATDEYMTKLSRLEHMLNNDAPRAIGLLERMILALEAYASVGRPADSPPDDDTGGDKPSND